MPPRPAQACVALLTLLAATGAAEEIANYTVIDAARIEAPIGGAEGDPARGAALFADPETGGCASCHRIAGSPIVAAPAPGILTEALPDPEPTLRAAAEGPPPNPPAGEAAAPAPASAPLPASRPAAATQGRPAPFEPPRLTLPRGPALDGVADRLSEAELRLVVVNPRLRRPESPMPAYYDVSPERAEAAPGLRQPWLSPQQVEDLVAYLAALDGADTGN